MKTHSKQIKAIMYLTLLLLSISVYSQNEIKEKNIFVRIYNMEGKKISNGHVLIAADTLIGLKKGGKITKINIIDIGYIKTKRSAGNNVLVGSAIGATSMAILGAASADPEDFIFGYTASEGALIGGILGALSGGAIGGVTALFKKPYTYIINGDIEKWKVFKESVNH